MAKWAYAKAEDATHRAVLGDGQATRVAFLQSVTAQSVNPFWVKLEELPPAPPGYVGWRQNREALSFESIRKKWIAGGSRGNFYDVWYAQKTLWRKTKKGAPPDTPPVRQDVGADQGNGLSPLFVCVVAGA